MPEGRVIVTSEAGEVEIELDRAAVRWVLIEHHLLGVHVQHQLGLDLIEVEHLRIHLPHVIAASYQDPGAEGEVAIEAVHVTDAIVARAGGEAQQVFGAPMRARVCEPVRVGVAPVRDLAAMSHKWRDDSINGQFYLRESLKGYSDILGF